MKRKPFIPTVLLATSLLLTPILSSCNQSDTAAPTSHSTTTATTSTTTDAPSSTTAPSTEKPSSTTTTPSTDAPTPDTPPTTTTKPETEPETKPETLPETNPEPIVLPGNPDQYDFTKLPYQEPDAWFGFDEPSHWSFWYTPQTNISNSLDLSLLKPSTYDEATKNWVPSADAYEQGWRQDNSGYATLTPITGMSAVMAFTAPEAGTYEFEFYIAAGNLPGTESDGVEFFLFGDGRIVYSQVCYNGENDELNDPYIVERIALDKGERAYFVTDPRKDGVGDVCKNISMIRIQRQIEQHVDNQNIFAFGHCYDKGTQTQGTHGWYAGYIDPNAALTPHTIGTAPMPDDLVAGVVFNWGDGGEPDQMGTILWEAPEDGTYTVSVKGWWHENCALISFYSNGELITAVEDDFFSGIYQMTCTLQKGECFAITFTHSETPEQDNISELELVIERN